MISSELLSEYPQGTEAGAILFTKKGPINIALRKRRDELGLTQAGLAESTGTHNSSISHFELLLNLPDPELAQRIAERLDIEVEKIFPPWLEFFKRSKPDLKGKNIMEICNSQVGREELERAYQLERIMYETTPSVMTDPVQAYERRAFEERIEYVGSTLRPDRKKVMWKWIGLEDGHKHTLEEIGREIGVDRNRAWTIKESALKKLRHPSRSKHLSEYSRQDEVRGTSVNSPEALLNGAISAICQGDSQRAFANIAKVEEVYLNGLDQNKREMVVLIEQKLEFCRWDSEEVNSFLEGIDNSNWSFRWNVRYAVNGLKPAWNLKLQMRNIFPQSQEQVSS